VDYRIVILTPIFAGREDFMHYGNGYLKVTVLDLPFYIHWSVPASSILLWPVAGIAPVEALLYCYFAIVCLAAVHELGHAAAAWYLKLKVHAIYFNYGGGGSCPCDLPSTAKGLLLLYSAGLLAEAVVLLATFLVTSYVGDPVSMFGKCIVFTFVQINIVMMVFTLLPITYKDGQSTDGKVLWQIVVYGVRLLMCTVRRFTHGGRVFPRETRLLAKKGFRPPGFATGIEILNDRTTPMHLVVSVLQRHLGLEPGDAEQVMRNIHARGGVLIAIAGMEESRAVAAAISQDASANGHQLVCRAVHVSGD
jgi:ATP-dependent Clp protease adapter protein ClpS